MKTINLKTAQKSYVLFISFLSILFFVNHSTLSGQETAFNEGFESGIGSWFADNGVWEVGIPTRGPASAHTGENCAGTVLGGNYPRNADTRLISPRIDLPTLSSEEELQIRFWHWFNQFPQDPGRVQVSTDNGANWTSISRNFVQNGNAWTQHIIDISEYANSTVRFAFYFTSDGGSEANGWFVDDISIVKGVFRMPNPEGFELGIGDWNVEQGVWEVGIPTRGPASAHTGENCAGTVLGGNYPRNADTRLISPRIDLPALSSEEELQIRFWHWFNQFPQDPGRVQVSTDNGANWTSISRNFVQNGNAWTQHIIDISEYANSTVRFAFYFTSDGGSEANGWFVDDISIVKGVFRMPNPEGFELGIGDWNVEQGVWEVGIPTRGPASAHTGENCAGTVLGGNYPRNADTRSD